MSCRLFNDRPAIRFVDVATGRALRRLPVDEQDALQVTSLDWSRDGEYLAAAGQIDAQGEYRTLIWRLDEPRILRRLPGGYRVALSPDGSRVSVCRGGGMLAVFDAATTEEIFAVEEKPNFGSMAWHPTGRYLAAHNWSQRVHVWDTVTWRELAVLQLNPELPAWAVDGNRVLEWSPDGSRLDAGSSQGDVVIWNPFTVRELNRFQASTRRILSLAWSPDGSRLVTCGLGGTFKIWDTALGEQVAEHRVDAETPIGSVLWSRQQRQLITPSDKALTIWDATRGYQLADASHPVDP